MSPSPMWRSRSTATASSSRSSARRRAAGSMPISSQELSLHPGEIRVRLEERHARSAAGRAVSVPPAVRLLLGYVWPKWVRTGERSEFRVHSVEPYQLRLWRYGLEKEFIAMLGWFDEHGPRAVMQITPDGDYTADRRRVEQDRLRQPAPHPVRHRPGALRALLPARQDGIRQVSSPSPGSSPRRNRQSRDRRHRVDQHLERLQQLRRPQQLRQLDRSAADADGQRPPGPAALHADR